MSLQMKKELGHSLEFQQKMEIRQRVRTKNYEPREEELLLSMIEPNKSVVDSKRIDYLANARKEACWTQFSKTFNKLGYARTPLQLKFKWDNMKKIARRKAARREEAARVGGDPNQAAPLSSVDKKILYSILSNENGADSRFESDVTELGNNSNSSSHTGDGGDDVEIELKREEEDARNTCDSSLRNPVNVAFLEPGSERTPLITETYSLAGTPKESIAQSTRASSRGERPKFEELLKYELAAAKIDAEMKEMKKMAKIRAAERRDEIQGMKLRLLQQEFDCRERAERRLDERHHIELDILRGKAMKD